MNSLVFAALVTSAAGIGSPPSAMDNIANAAVHPSGLEAASVRGAGPVKPMHVARPGLGQHRWGGNIRGKWAAGWRAPGGWSAYRKPFRGFVLPRYWLNPSFYVVNYPAYGLARPSAGYNWVRYYDDAVLTDSYGRVYDSVPGVGWGDYDEAGRDRHEPASYAEPAAHYDDSAYNWDAGADDEAENNGEDGTYKGRWSGAYVDQEGRVYKGRWDGTYTDEDGRVYRGSYKGTMTGDARYRSEAVRDDDNDQTGSGHAPPRREIAPTHSYHRSIDGYEQCRKDNGLGGAVIGGVTGGVAGAAIAGRGNRTGGALIGAGVGAVAGAAIDRAEDKCEAYRPSAYRARHHEVYSRDEDPRGRYNHDAPSGYGWQGHTAYVYPGYYYAAPQTTTIVIQPGISTTTTTSYVVEEPVYTKVRARKIVKRPVRRPACQCK